MKLMTLAITAVTMFSATGFSQERSERSGNQNRRVVISVNEDRSDINQNQRIRELERSVRDLQTRMYDLEDLVRGNYPLPPTRPVGPVCTLLGYGVASGYYHNFRVAVDGNVLAGHSTMDDAVNTIKRYKESNVCVLNSYDSQCSLLGYGVAAGYYHNFRIELKTAGKSEVLSGYSTDSAALTAMSKLKSAGICQ